MEEDKFIKQQKTVTGMKAFVTGGSGFIGHALVERLLKDGYEVTILDLQEPTVKHKNVTWVNKSVMDEIAEDMHGHDIVFHFAAILGVDNSDNRPMDTMHINLEGSVNVFRTAVSVGIKDMIYASSSEVYGEPREIPIREDSTKGPVSTYGVSKLAAEIYAKAFNHEFATNIHIVRFFNVYGPRQPHNFVVPIFLDKAMANQEIKVFGDGSQNRCFTYVEDAVDGVMQVIKKGKIGEAYNIGNNKPTTIYELAKIVKAATKSKSDIVKAGFGKETRLKEREIEYRVPDISRIQGLGWKPTTLVEEGISKVIEFRKSP